MVHLGNDQSQGCCAKTWKLNVTPCILILFFLHPHHNPSLCRADIVWHKAPQRALLGGWSALKPPTGLGRVVFPAPKRNVRIAWCYLPLMLLSL